MANFTRAQGAVLGRRLAEPRRFIVIPGSAPLLIQRVDFVARAGRAVTAIEVKNARARHAQPGLAAFPEAFRPKRSLLVGGDGIPVEAFLSRPAEHWVG